MEKKMFRDTTHKLVHGHEGWMEDFISHYHAGDPIMAMLKWGHNCQSDGMAKMDTMTYTVCAPDGTIEPVKCELGDEDCYDLTADTLEEGYYTFIATYDNCWAQYGEGDDDWKFGDRKQFSDAMNVYNYNQYATLIVPVGHFHEREMYTIPSMRLSVLPTTGSDYQETHKIDFRVILEGKPLPNHPAIVVRLLDDGSTVEQEVQSDENGIISYVPEQKGTYVIIVRAKDDVQDPDGRYEGTRFTATHGFRVSEHSHHHGHHDHNDEGGHEHSHDLHDELFGAGGAAFGFAAHEHEHEHEHQHEHEHHHTHEHSHGGEHHSHEHDHIHSHGHSHEHGHETEHEHFHGHSHEHEPHEHSHNAGDCGCGCGGKDKED